MGKTSGLAEAHLRFFFKNEAPVGGQYEDVGDGLVPATTPGDLFVSLHTADPGGGNDQSANEASYTGYARVAVDRTTGNNEWAFTGPNQIANNILLNFGKRTNSGSQTLLFWGVGTDVSGVGNLCYSAPLALADSIPFVVEAADAASEDITAPNHGYVADDRVMFIDVSGVSLPGGLSANTAYYVITAGLAADTFRVALTSEGSAVDTGAVGSGRVAKVQPVVAVLNSRPEIAVGALVIREW